ALCAAGAALVSLIVAARAGAFTQLWDFLDYGAGVISLVSLTSTVLWGLVATDRVLLESGHRLLAQGAHRGLAVSGLGFLALHIWVKIAEQRTTAGSAMVPFTDLEQPVLIGLGTLAGYLFLAVAVSGAVRSAFATKGRSLWWRALHLGAYPAWGASLVHGLKAGRPADTWVTAAYALCLVGVAGLLALRLRSRMRDAPSRPAAPQAAPQTPVTVALPRQRRGTRTAASARPAPPPRPDYPPRAAVYAPSPAGSGRDGEQFATPERWM
ncbi:cytochrome b/b6 domain-containing protein, partial [Streptomyces sp. NPDC054849]